MTMKLDTYFMRRCLELALKGSGHVSPNPLVGAVIVKNGKILAEGYHRRVGADHAEINALKKIHFQAKRATLYCNLEPCFHQGRTHPCVHRVIQSGISRVVIAHQDPNPLVCGRSIKLLRKHGIQVTVGVLEKEARFLNRFFITWIQKKRPYVILKAAITLDGKIARKETPKGKIEWITGPIARKRVHQIRSQVDAILVGVNTIIQDNPQLNIRGIKGAKQPCRIVLDTHLRTPLHSKIFSSRGGPVIIVTVKKSVKAKHFSQKKKGEILFLEGNKISLKSLLKKLALRGLTSLMVEGGSQIYTSFYREGLVDEIALFVAPKIYGNNAIPLFASIPKSARSPKAIRYYLENKKWKQLQKDIAFRAAHVGISSEEDIENLIDEVRR